MGQALKNDLTKNLSKNLTKREVVSSDQEPLILVDGNDTEIGFLDKSACHDGEGTLHRAFSLFIVNSNGELLIHQRASAKRLWQIVRRVSHGGTFRSSRRSQRRKEFRDDNGERTAGGRPQFYGTEGLAHAVGNYGLTCRFEPHARPHFDRDQGLLHVRT